MFPRITPGHYNQGPTLFSLPGRATTLLTALQRNSILATLSLTPHVCGVGHYRKGLVQPQVMPTSLNPGSADEGEKSFLPLTVGDPRLVWGRAVSSASFSPVSFVTERDSPQPGGAGAPQSFAGLWVILIHTGAWSTLPLSSFLH